MLRKIHNLPTVFFLTVILGATFSVKSSGQNVVIGNVIEWEQPPKSKPTLWQVGFSTTKPSAAPSALFLEKKMLFNDSIAREQTLRFLFRGGLDSVAIIEEEIDTYESDIEILYFRRPDVHIGIDGMYGGGIGRGGIYVEAEDIAGLNISAEIEAGYSSELDIGFGGAARLFWRPASAWQVAIMTEGDRLAQRGRIEAGLLPLRDRQAGFFGKVYFENFSGQEFRFGEAAAVNNAERENFGGMIGYKGNVDWEQFHVGVSMHRQTARYDDFTFRHAGDGITQIYVSLSAYTPNFDDIGYVEGRGTSPVVRSGSYGSAHFGVLQPDGGADALYYLGGEASQIVSWGERSFINGYIAAGTALGDRGTPALTAQETHLRSAFGLSQESSLKIKLHQQTVWNWLAFRQLVLDNDAGIRGLPVNSRSGSNRIVISSEYVQDNVLRLLGGTLSGVAFLDAGTVWEQEIEFTRTQWSVSVGGGLRWQLPNSINDSRTLRLDACYLLQLRTPAIVVSLRQAFDLFGSLKFAAPRIIGGEPEIR